MALELDDLRTFQPTRTRQAAPAPEPGTSPVTDLRRPPGILAQAAATPAPLGTVGTGSDDDAHRWFTPDRLEPGLRCRTVRPDTALGVRAESFVYDVFRTSGFCAESPRRHVEETEPWRNGSLLHVITDDGDPCGVTPGHADPGGGSPEPGRIVGVVRTITGAYDDLPVARFDPEVPVPGGLLCEIGSLAVTADQRGLGVANELHRAAFRTAIEAGADGLCCIIEQWMFDFFAEVYGLPVRRLAPPTWFMGGDIVPTGMWLPEMLHVIAERRPNVYRWSVEDVDENLLAALDLPMVLP